MSRPVRILAGIFLLVWALFLSYSSYMSLRYSKLACMVALQSSAMALQVVELHDVPAKGSLENDNLPPVPDTSWSQDCR